MQNEKRIPHLDSNSFKARFSKVMSIGLALLIAPPLAAQVPVRVYDAANPVRASIGLEPTSYQRYTDPIERVDLKFMPGLDLDFLTQDDIQREQDGLPYRFAVPNEISYTPSNSGTWEQLDGRTWLWRLRVIAPDAKSINLGFTRYTMPEGGILFVHATDRSQYVRGFTSADNETHGQLWTPPVLGDDLTIEVTIPDDKKALLDLELGSINHGYRGYFTKDGAAALSGSCNVDVVCPEGDPWSTQIDGVAAIAIGGVFACTGFMVNNTALDRRPFFMTAEHCSLDIANAASLIAFWNYQNSTCRTPGSAASGSPGDGVLSDFNSGSIHRAEYLPSDMTLVELDDDPDPLFGVTFLGWDRSTGNPASAVGIHHPQVEEKRISFENNALTTTSYSGVASPGDGTHLRVTDWDLGTTEGGSSGSPLFDQAAKRVVGQLHGGSAACGNNLSDWYGRFSVSWIGGGTNSSRLSNWLDPIPTGATIIDALSPLIDCNANGIHDPQEIAGNPSLDCQPNGILDACELGSFVVENFDSVGVLAGKGWAIMNNSSIVTGSTLSWGQGNPAVFSAQSGSSGSYVSANYLSTDDGAGTETISNWLMTPEVDLVDGRTFSFWTRTATGSTFPDNLQVRLSTSGPSINVGATTTSVGDFTTLLVEINPTLSVGGYPEVWTQYNLVLSGIGAPTTGRFAFRYFVTNSGPAGVNSNFIGIDTVSYQSLTNDTNEDGIPDDCAGAVCKYDINLDNQIAVVDLLDLLGHWGACPLPCTPGVPESPDTCPWDGNRDCAVAVVDLLELLGLWGPCP